MADAASKPDAASPKAGKTVETKAVPSSGDTKKENGKDEKRRERSPSRSRRRHRERSRSDSRRGRRERSRDRGGRRERSDSRKRRRERSRDRRRERRSRSKSRGRRSKSYSRSRSRGQSRSRSRSKSRSPPAPLPIYRPPPMMSTMSSYGGMPMGLSTMPTGLATMPTGLNPLLTNPYLIPNLSGGTQAAGLSQATRPARRLYVGGLPNPCYDYQLQTFLNQALVALGLCRTTGKMPIITCSVSPERGFAFIEFADMTDATCALALDGIPYMGVTLKIKRPKDYNVPYGAPPDPQPLGAAALAALLAQQSHNAMAGAAVATATGVPQGSAPAPTPTVPSLPAPATGGIGSGGLASGGGVGGGSWP